MRRFLLFTALLFLFLSPIFAQAEDEWYIGKPIKDIRFQGIFVASQKELDPIIIDFKGKTFTEELWVSLLSRVYGLDLFAEISPEAIPSDAAASSVIILFRVVENPAVSTIVIEGNNGLRSSEILEAISIKTRTIFNSSRLRMDEIAIRQLYQRKGFPDIAVSSHYEERADGNIDVYFTVEEGYLNYVSLIQFEGISAFSARTLKGQIEVKEKGLFQSGFFSEARLEESRMKLEMYYKKRGYIDARVADIEREITEDAKGARAITLIFTIEEGKKYIYDGMSFIGNTVYPDEKLASLVRQKPGSIVNYEKLLLDQERVADIYFDNGYIFNSFDLTESRDEERGTIAYRLVIGENTQAIVESIEIRGLVKTKDHVVRREIPIKDGDIFSKGKILEGIRNLYQLQYFSSIIPSYEPGYEEPYIKLVITVEEQSTAQIEFGMSFAPSDDPDDFPLVVKITWRENNFLGNGQAPSIGLEVNTESQEISLGFTENWLFGHRWSGTANLGLSHSLSKAAQDANMDGIRDPYLSLEEYKAANPYIPYEYKMKYETWSFDFGLGSSYTLKFGLFDINLGGRYDISLANKIYDPDVFNPYDPEGTISANLNTWLLSNSITLGTYINGLDIWYDPSNGYFVSQRFGMTGFSRNELARYFRSDSKAEGYLTLVNWQVSQAWALKLVLGAHSRFTALLPWFGEDRPVLPQGARILIIDGSLVGRGWGNSLAGNLGTSLWENWVELRFPVVPGVFSLDGFVDIASIMTEQGLLDIAGTVTHNNSTYSGSTWSSLAASNLAISAGFGIRITLPQLPLRLYFAKPFYIGDDGLAPVNTADKWNFVISISQPLN